MRKKFIGGKRVVTMTPEEFKNLPEYSCTIPTGTTVGKRWRCNQAFGTGRKPQWNDWYMGEYVKHPDPKMVGIEWSRIRVLE